MKPIDIVIIIVLLAIIAYMNYRNKKSPGAAKEQQTEPEATIKDLEKMPYKKKLLLTKTNGLFIKL